MKYGLIEFLQHMKDTGGYVVGDPIEVGDDTIDEAEREGFVAVSRDGTCTMRPRGAAKLAWFRANAGAVLEQQALESFRSVPKPEPFR